MKILAFIDLHSDVKSLRRVLEKSSGVDLVIGAGDLSDWGKDIRKILLYFKKIDKPFLVIHGNHEDETDLKNICSDLKFPSYIHKKQYELNGYTFIGYGGGGFSLEDKEFERFYKSLKIKKDSKVVFITHGPPYGTKCDYLQRCGFTGCRSYNKMIKELKPILHICGHIHENSSCKDKIGSTTVMNPGKEGKIIRI